MRITAKSPFRLPDGSISVAGAVYDVSTAFAAIEIGQGRASDTDLVLLPPRDSAASVNDAGVAQWGGRKAAVMQGQTPAYAAGLLPIMPTDDASMWSSDKTAALIVEVDPTVTFNGRPSIKITVPAGTSGTVKVGTIAANARVPYNWDKNNFALAIKSSNLSLASAFTCYLGDSTYTNFFTNSNPNIANYPQWSQVNDEWMLFPQVAAQWTTGGGAPAVASQMRAKIQFTAVSQATDTYIWIGFYGVMPKKAKPCIVWTLDDGYASWNSFIAPLFKHHQMPTSMGIDRALVGANNYLTAAQVQALYADPSRLFDIVNHGENNQNYSTLGAAAYAATFVRCRDYLRSLGVVGDGPLHHPLVASLWGNDLLPLLEAEGCLSARASTYTAQAGKDQYLALAKQRFVLNIASNLQTGKSLAQAKADVDTVVADGGFGMINAHDFASAAAAFVYDYDSMEQLVGYVASLRDAGTLEVKSWSRWWADLTGRVTDRR